jgi:hypothetical protein
MTARQFLAAGILAILDATEERHVLVLDRALEGDPAALAALVAFARIVRRIRDDAPEPEIHEAIRRLLRQLADLHAASRRAAA